MVVNSVVMEVPGSATYLTFLSVKSYVSLNSEIINEKAVKLIAKNRSYPTGAPYQGVTKSSVHAQKKMYEVCLWFRL